MHLLNHTPATHAKLQRQLLPHVASWHSVPRGALLLSQPPTTATHR
jgi:hypothetical protein